MILFENNRINFKFDLRADDSTLVARTRFVIRRTAAYLNGKRISVANRGLEHSILAFGSSPYYKKELGEKSFKLCHEIFMSCSDIRRCGSAALDLAYLAAGRNDMFFECTLSPWDYAAGQLIVKEAGGIVSDMDGNPLCFNKRSPVLAATPSTYDELLEKVRKYM